MNSDCYLISTVCNGTAPSLHETAHSTPRLPLVVWKCTTFIIIHTQSSLMFIICRNHIRMLSGARVTDNSILSDTVHRWQVSVHLMVSLSDVLLIISHWRKQLNSAEPSICPLPFPPVNAVCGLFPPPLCLDLLDIDIVAYVVCSPHTLRFSQCAN